MIERIKEKKKLLIHLVLITALMILVFSMVNKCSRKMVDEVEKNDKIIYQTEEVRKQLSVYNYDETKIIINDLAEKGSDWSRFPLSQNFLSKYNNNEGIFPEYKDYYDTTWNFGLYGKNDIINNRFDVQYGINWYLNPKEDRPKDRWYKLYNVKVTYLINNKNEIDDIIKSEPEIIFENGEPNIEYDKEVTVDNFRQLIIDILFFDAEKNFIWNGIPPEPKNIRKEPCSKKLCDKVLNKDKNVDRIYIDFFPEYNCGGGALYYSNGTTIEDAFNNKECFVSCRVFRDGAEPYYEWEDPEHNYLYKLNFEIDEEGKLDDIKLEFIREISNEELEANYHF